jgi:F-type H+-transporting ATPase subunit c
MEVQVAKMIGAALAILPLFGVGLAIGQIFSTLISSVARNPSVKNDVFPMAILGFALTEACALFSLLIAFLILFK